MSKIKLLLFTILIGTIAQDLCGQSIQYDRVIILTDIEAGSYQGKFELGQPENPHMIHGVAPEVSGIETIHIILKVTDKGKPPLSRYRRIIIEITPI